MIVADFTQTRPVGDGSMMLSGQSSGLPGSELQNLAKSLTPANIRASARQEVALSTQKDLSSHEILDRSGRIIRAKTHSQSGFQLNPVTQAPRAAEQVAYLLK